MREHEINKLNNFISGWYIEDSSICENLIKYHNDSEKTRGNVAVKTQGNVEKKVDLDSKNSWDVSVDDPSIDVIASYKKQLHHVVSNYIKQYEYCNSGSPWLINESPNIQHYPPGGGYYTWHCENIYYDTLLMSRHLVFMTYLNDVNDGGETEFLYQGIKVKPERGLTLIWPTTWTHTHRGIQSLTENKYIITGWFHLISDEYYQKCLGK